MQAQLKKNTTCSTVCIFQTTTKTIPFIRHGSSMLYRDLWVMCVTSFQKKLCAEIWVHDFFFKVMFCLIYLSMMFLYQCINIEKLSIRMHISSKARKYMYTPCARSRTLMSLWLYITWICTSTDNSPQYYNLTPDSLNFRVNTPPSFLLPPSFLPAPLPPLPRDEGGKVSEEAVIKGLQAAGNHITQAHTQLFNYFLLIVFQ